MHQEQYSKLMALLWAPKPEVRCTHASHHDGRQENCEDFIELSNSSAYWHRAKDAANQTIGLLHFKIGQRAPHCSQSYLSTLLLCAPTPTLLIPSMFGLA